LQIRNLIFSKECSVSIFKLDYYFVLGDNLLHSMDSRHLGLIKEEDIIGKVIF